MGHDLTLRLSTRMLLRYECGMSVSDKKRKAQWWCMAEKWDELLSRDQKLSSAAFHACGKIMINWSYLFFFSTYTFLIIFDMTFLYHMSGGCCHVVFQSCEYGNPIPWRVTAVARMERIVSETTTHMSTSRLSSAALFSNESEVRDMKNCPEFSLFSFFFCCCSVSCCRLFLCLWVLWAPLCLLLRPHLSTTTGKNVFHLFFISARFLFFSLWCILSEFSWAAPANFAAALCCAVMMTFYSELLLSYDCCLSDISSLWGDSNCMQRIQSWAAVKKSKRKILKIHPHTMIQQKRKTVANGIKIRESTTCVGSRRAQTTFFSLLIL